MGSSQLSSTSHSKTGPCPLNALGPGSGTFNATCEVTNKIDINKYFELMREEYKDVTKRSLQRPPGKKPIARSFSSGNIQPSPVTQNSKNNNYILPISPRRKKNAKKRISCDEKSLSMYAAKNHIKHSETYFNYDLSGHIVESPVGAHVDDHHLSKQKSWDLSSSKVKNPEVSSDEDEKDDLSLSYSCGDFRDYINNNEGMKSSKSCETISNLGERHKHHAMMQGKISSVSEQNRRLRRRYYKKERKGSDEKTKKSNESDVSVSGLLKEKLVIDNVSLDHG